MCNRTSAERPTGMVTVLLALALWSSAPRGKCSPIPVAMFRDTTVTYLVGRPLPDTVAAGVGATLPSTDQGHWGTGRARPVFGQVIRVDRLGGADSAALEMAFGRLGQREVVVVPWDYGPDCRPVIWGRSFRWVQSPAPGFYRLRARPAAASVNGRPVLDAFRADLEPYPHGIFFLRGYRGTDAAHADGALTPAEYLTFYSALPSYPAARENREEARVALDALERRYPDLISRYPASEALRFARAVLGP